MSTPKSVIKVNKNGVQYTSSVDKCNYFIFELTRGALRDVGKFVCKKFKDAYYQHFKRKLGNAGKSVKYSVWSSKNTQYPRVQIGLKKDAVGFYSMFQEVGSSKTKRLGLLAHCVEDNVAEIVKIESQYLSALESEASALNRIDESEMEGDADGEE
jgi:hypothetical protein